MEYLDFVISLCVVVILFIVLACLTSMIIVLLQYINRSRLLYKLIYGDPVGSHHKLL